VAGAATRAKAADGSCHLNRPIDRLIESAGLRIIELELSYAPGYPKPWGAGYLGTALRRTSAGEAACSGGAL
jgi:hypothetical protein